jgi:hypothetical protein
MVVHRLPNLSESFHPKSLTLGLIASLAFVGLSQNSLHAQGGVVSKVTAWAKGHGKPPTTHQDKALEELAKNVDWLEHHINQWGSVSSKAPDVWGEARLTQYRREVEEILEPLRKGFDPARIAGAQQVSDSALLAVALAMQNQTPTGGVAPPAITVNSIAKTSTPKEGEGEGEATINLSSALPTPSSPFNLQTTGFLGKALGIEQTQEIDQLVRYMQHLNQHRRINEGDDTSDAPGYSLNLVRVPVSILPGAITKRGYGAEITYTAKPYLGPDLLPMTFRDMVLNDLTDQLSIPLVKFINSDPNGADKIWELAKKLGPRFNADMLGEMISNRKLRYGSLPDTHQEEAFATLNEARGLVKRSFTSVCAISFSGNQTRRGQQPFPPTQIIDVYGLDEMLELAVTALKGLREDVPNRRVVHLPDVQSFLREELIAAIELMYSEGMQSWWDRESTGEKCLVNLIRMRRTDQIDAMRDEFLRELAGGQDLEVSHVLAWCVYVDSILLNERLNDDIRETTGTRPSDFSHPCWMPFFGPDPSPEARDTFARYVQLRWPIRVFALDPQIDQQSIADASSVIRQMQLAVVMGFSSGNLGLSAAMDTIRKLQRDRATIDLNRTAIAFGHGDDTFGWRFQPRFQTPPVEGNAKVFFRDLIVGGPTDRQLERSCEIEPGIRECTAIILMPSFVPYVTFETHGHWFKLANPGHTGTSVQEDVHLSRAIKQMQDRAMTCVRCSHLYRDGEVDRVMARVEQLEKRLPLQTISCQVPIENTHGGFELFCNGTRQLSPEVTGWYGAPGYDPSRETDLFITGDNFSIKQSHVIAGSRNIEKTTLISRQTLQIKLPPGLPVMKDTRLLEHENTMISADQRYEGYVDVQVATPYGVSAHLLVPVVRRPAPAPVPDCPPTELTVDEYAMVLTLTREKGAFKTFVHESALPPPIITPKATTLGAESCKVRLYLTHNNAALSPVEYAKITKARGQDGLQIPAPEYIKSIAPKGALEESLMEYIKFLKLQNAIPDVGTTLEFTAEYTIEHDKTELPVEGSFPLFVQIEPVAK